MASTANAVTAIMAYRHPTVPTTPNPAPDGVRWAIQGSQDAVRLVDAVIVKVEGAAAGGTVPSALRAVAVAVRTAALGVHARVQAANTFTHTADNMPEEARGAIESGAAVANAIRRLEAALTPPAVARTMRGSPLAKRC